MGKQSTTPPSRRPAGIFRALLLLLFIARSAAALSAQSANVPLILPGGLAFDSAGDLYFAETGNHVVRRLTAAGALSIVAGTGTQGYAGDGGLATAALLDSPAGVAVDVSGNLFIADTHNRCIRRVDAVSGLISTVANARLPVALAFSPKGALVFADAGLHQILQAASGSPIAGSGVQGFSGDGGPATLAEIDSPYGLAFDSAGNLYIADTHNQRIRRVDAATGAIATVAGTGNAGFAGDGSAASTGQLSLPRGVTLDASGNLYVADSRNQRIRRIDAVTGAMTTITGNGTQAFLGDGSPAVTGSLDSPRAVVVSGFGVPVLADANNNRVREVDGSANLQTIAGVGAISPARVASATSLVQTSTQTLTASVTGTQGMPAGNVSLVDGTTSTASALLTNGSAAFATSLLSTGSHTLTSVYSGSSAYLPSTSAPLIVTTGGTIPADFTLVANAPSAISVTSGASATFGFSVAPTNAPLANTVALSATGAPIGAMVTFNPGSVAPSAGPSTFVLTIATPAKAELGIPAGAVSLGCGLWLLGLRRRIRRLSSKPLLFVIPEGNLHSLARVPFHTVAVLMAAWLLIGCGARVNAGGSSNTAVTYNVTVTASSTSASGAALVHTAVVTLTVQ